MKVAAVMQSLERLSAVRLQAAKMFAMLSLEMMMVMKLLAEEERLLELVHVKILIAWMMTLELALAIGLWRFAKMRKVHLWTSLPFVM